LRNIYIYINLVGKPEGKIPLGKPRRRWENSIKIILKKQDMSLWIGIIWLKI
jgi:hypothetical protein